MNKTEILNKLIAHYKFKTNAEFAKFLGIKPQVLSNWKARNTFDIELISSKCLDINSDWLLTGKGAKTKVQFKETAPVHAPDFTHTQAQIPLYLLENTNNLIPDLSESDQAAYVSLPGVAKADGATVVVNENMHPVLAVGDLVTYKVVALDVKKLVFNKMYLLSIFIDEVKTYKTIRYVHKSPLGLGYVRLVNEDKQYLDRDIELSKIAALGIIQSVIRIK